MAYRQNRVASYHPRTGIAHHRFNALTHFGLVAMHRALVADRLIVTERALGNTLIGIRKKPGAIGTKILPRAMVGAAENSDHDSNGPGFEVIHVLDFIERPSPFQG